jgi:TonB family protein
MKTIKPKFAKNFLLAAACLALFALAGACAFAQSTQSSKKPISLIGLEDAIKEGGLMNAELIEQIKSRGVDFVLTPEIGDTLRGLGASQALIQAVGANYRGIAGTTWNYFILAGAQHGTFTYEPGGALQYKSSASLPCPGTWTLTGDEVYMECNKKFIEYHGTVSGTHMSGTVSNARGWKSTWTADEAAGANDPGTPAPKKATTPNKVNLSAGVAVGLLIQKTVPQYPSVAKAARVSGTVVLKATISKLGTIESLQVVSGPELLQQAALDAVKTWRYRPYLRNNEPVEVDTTINVTFTLGK